MRAFFSSLLLLLLPSFISAQETQPNSKCNCPQFEIVSELEMVKAGEAVVFEIVSTDSTVFDRKFAWTTSAGTIISGQGTRKISIQTTAEMLPPLTQPTGPFVSGSRRRSVPLNVTVVPGTDCACSAISGSVRVGFRTQERNKPADATDLKLSVDKLTLPCDPGSRPWEGVIVSPTLVIDVAVEASDPENDILTYNYTVSGGRIVGSGASVKWDLSQVAPGTYTITAGADDGCGVCGKTQSKTVTVIACQPSCSLIECPTIEIAGPGDTISRGDNSFTANVSGGTQESVTYEWIVNNGEIVSGRGSPSIVVRFSEGSINLPTSITLRIGGVDPRAACITEQKLTFENGRRKP